MIVSVAPVSAPAGFFWLASGWLASGWLSGWFGLAPGWLSGCFGLLAAVQRRELHRRVHHGRGRLGRSLLRCAHGHRHAGAALSSTEGVSGSSLSISGALKQLFDSVEAKQYKRPDMNGDLRLGFASDDFAGTKWKNLTGTTRWSDGTEIKRGATPKACKNTQKQAQLGEPVSSAGWANQSNQRGLAWATRASYSYRPYINVLYVLYGRQPAKPSQSPGSLLYVLYVLSGSHKASR